MAGVRFLCPPTTTYPHSANLPYTASHPSHSGASSGGDLLARGGVRFCGVQVTQPASWRCSSRGRGVAALASTPSNRMANRGSWRGRRPVASQQGRSRAACRNGPSAAGRSAGRDVLHIYKIADHFTFRGPDLMPNLRRLSRAGWSQRDYARSMLSAASQF